MRLVMGDGLRAALAGILLAIPFVVVVMRLLRLLTFKSGMLDGVAFAVTVALVLSVALVASAWPALAALRISPMESIRTD